MSQNEPVDGEKGNIRHQDGIKTAEYGIRMAKAGNKTANYVLSHARPQPDFRETAVAIRSAAARMTPNSWKSA